MHMYIWAALTAFGIVLLFGSKMIDLLKKLNFGQTIYDLGLHSHKAKQGVPTMGGLIMIFAVLVCMLLFTGGSSKWDFALFVLVSGLANAAIGFWDDFIKVCRKRSEGLTPKQKILLQILVGIGLSVWAYCDPAIGSKVIVPWFNVEWNLGIFFFPIMILMVIFMANSSNLLDGADGLCSTCSLVGYVTFVIICCVMALGVSRLPVPEGADALTYAENVRNAGIVCAAAAGAVIGFLRFNTNPARVIMGDTGSMFLGGLFIGLGFVTRLEILLLPVCAMMVISSLSDILQVAYTNMTGGKRLLRMSPLHHHLEALGMSEPRIVSMYMITSIVLCMFALLAL